jgi:hypothetical protein
VSFSATVRVIGAAGRFEDFRERVRRLLVRDIDAECYTEHHAPGRLVEKWAGARGTS